jgi:hypothetical protein
MSFIIYAVRKIDRRKADMASRASGESIPGADALTRVLTLPPKEEILRRLRAVALEEHGFADRIFRHIAEEDGGKELNGGGVVIMFTHAIARVTEGHPPAMQRLLHMEVARWIRALIDDSEIADAAVVFHEEGTGIKGYSQTP